MPRQLLRHAQSVASPTHVFLGNSTMAAGFDENAFSSAAPGTRPLNLGLGATMPAEHYLLLRQRPLDAGAAVVYGFFDTQLTDPVEGSWSTLIGNRALAYYVDPVVAANLYEKDSLPRRMLFRLIADVPLLSDRAALWGRVERARRTLGGIGVPAKAANQFGRVDDFAALELEPKEFVRRCASVILHSRPPNAAVVALLRRARESGNPAYVVAMPMTSAHRERYYSNALWRLYLDRMRRMLAATGATLLDAADWMPDDAFSDPLHLGQAGAREFSARLAKELAGAR
jgi:hypothetical protein